MDDHRLDVLQHRQYLQRPNSAVESVPDLQEVVKLSQAHMGDDVIVNYVRNSGNPTS